MFILYRWFVSGISRKKQMRILMQLQLLRYFDTKQRSEAIHKADIVISMLPAHLHIEGGSCIVYKEFSYGFIY
jgi:hypothetical protein